MGSHLVQRFRFFFILLLLITLGTPFVNHPLANAQDDFGETEEETATWDEDLYYQEEPAWDESVPAEDQNVYDESLDASPEPEDLSWLPHTPYQPIDFSPFTEALAAITPARMTELEQMIVEADITQLESLMAANQLTSQELVLFYIDRIMKYDVGQLDSITQINPDALYQAHLRDIQRTNGENKGPLQGIPVLLKENIATGDTLATTAGAIALADTPARRDAYLVQQLRDAGAVILGKTNMTEWANWMHMSFANGYSAFGGQTVSPFGDDPSGSSTGNAVAITANFAPLAIGTETIGSIISPSSRASVVGMHPTLGVVSNDNVIPLSPRLDTPGPMGKTVSDIAIAMTVFASTLDRADARSGMATPVAGIDFMTALDPNALQGVRLGIVPWDPDVSDEETLAFYDATGSISALEAAGAQIVVIHPSGMPDLDWWQLFTCGIRDGVDSYLTQNGISDPGSLADIVAINESDPERYIPLGQERLEEAANCTLSATELDTMASDIENTAQDYLDAVFQENDVAALVTLEDVYSLEYGLAGYPAITVPRGGTFPTSLTFVGPQCSDAALVGFAYAYEQTGQYRIVPDLVANAPVDATPEVDS